MKCPACNAGWKKCLSTCRICKECLQHDTLAHDAKCTCCSICKRVATDCMESECSGAQSSKKTLEKDAQARSRNNSIANATVRQRSGITDISLDSSVEDSAKETEKLKPPDISMLKDPSRLKHYILQLRRWSRIDKTKPKIKGEKVLLLASSQFPELSFEMDEQIGEKVTDNAEGVEIIIEFLQTKFGVDKQIDLIKSFKDFFFTNRGKQDLVTYVSNFERNYLNFRNQGEELSNICLSLLLLTNA